MAGPPTTVWVEVATELLAEMGEWSEPVQVRIHDLRPNGQVDMELRTTTDLALALRLLDEFAIGTGPCDRFTASDGQDVCETHDIWELEPDAPCPGAEAHALLVRHGIRDQP